MSGFSNLDETQSQTNVAFSTTNLRQRLDSIKLTWNTRTTLEKGLLIAVVGLSILALGLIIGLAVARGKGNDKSHEPSPSPEVCLTPDCTMAASRILESLDRSVNPCSDFYAYACGTWKKTNVIPDANTQINVVSILQEQIKLINKNLYEELGDNGANEEAWGKAKDAYASCMDTDQLEQKNLSVITPVLQALGGWPVLGARPGGNWDEGSFDLVSLLVKLAQYGIQPIIRLSVTVDQKNSTQRILQLGQSYEGYPRNEEAYFTFFKSMASLFGANPTQADTDMRQVLEFKRKLNNISMKKEDLQNPDLTYNKMTLAEIRRKFTEPRSTDPIQFSWGNFVRGIMNLEGVKVEVTDVEPIIVTTIPYIQKLFGVLQKTSKRTIVNFIIWSFMKDSELALALPIRFKDIYNQYQKAYSGQQTSSARWRECETMVTTYMPLAISQRFVKRKFDDTTRHKVGDMVKNIRGAFDELLHEVSWMDDHTKGLAKEKAEAIKSWIGYPDDLLNDTFINWIYKNVIVDREAFLLSILNYLKVFVAKTLRQLRQPYDKAAVTEVWSPVTPPTTVNAWYSPSLNDIIIPAGILHSPFYGKNQPQSLNYGSIGTILGHEITHGFDSTGRKYDKYGNLNQWWQQKIIDSFNKQASCMVNQYGSYVVQEVNMTINGDLTLGENIADNGGLKQSYRAYRRWVHDQGKEEPKLPGLDLTNNQLFFVSFAQHWCTNVNKQTAHALLLTDTHSPNQFRVIGTLQNSEEFAAAFSCPIKSYMNPENKCSVW